MTHDYRIRTSLEGAPSPRNEAEKAAMRMRAYEDYGVVVLELDRLSWDERALAERMFLDQQAAMTRDDIVQSNVERLGR